MWILSFIASYMYNMLAYYNDFSPKGSIDYRKWKAFEKFLNEYSSIQNQPLMGVTIWERYYAYAISLGCAGKFYDQMKSLKIADNTIDLEIFETFNGIVKCIGLSAKKVARISIDKYGGSHTEMIAN